jgi:hypothetical protein
MLHQQTHQDQLLSRMSIFADQLTSYTNRHNKVNYCLAHRCSQVNLHPTPPDTKISYCLACSCSQLDSPPVITMININNKSNRFFTHRLTDLISHSMSLFNCNTYFKILIKPYTLVHPHSFACHRSRQKRTRSETCDQKQRLRNISCVLAVCCGGVGMVMVAESCSQRWGRSIGCCLGGPLTVT